MKMSFILLKSENVLNSTDSFVTFIQEENPKITLRVYLDLVLFQLKQVGIYCNKERERETENVYRKREREKQRERSIDYLHVHNQTAKLLKMLEKGNLK